MSAGLIDIRPHLVRQRPNTTAAPPPAADADTLWQRFVEARAVAMASQDFADGVRAGRAWAAFINIFFETPSLGRPS
jgi:hypothetical protein